MSATTNDKLVLDLEAGAGTPHLTIELVTGEVEVSGWDQPQIVFTSPDADEDTEIADLFTLRKNGNEVVVGVNHGGHSRNRRNHPRDEWDIESMIRMATNAGKSVSADLQVKVPFGCDVEVRSASGDITIKSVDGKVSANSTSGGIELDDVQGSVLVKSASGDVDITRFSGRLGVRTISGEIKVKAGEIDGLSVGTASGDVEISGSLNPDGEYEIQTVSGEVELQLPRDTRCRAEIQTVSGDIDCDLPHETQKNGKRRQRLAINGGDGAELRISTTTGDVNIEEWRGAPATRAPRPAVTERLDNPGSGESSRAETGGQTVRMDAQPSRASAEMSILQAIETGDLTVEEGLRKLNELSQGF